jgi:hypothetical protein
MYTIAQRLTFLGLFVASVFIFQSCANDDVATVEENVQQSFELYLTDCPYEADEVNVEIISVLVEDFNGATAALNTNTGIYNLLDFTDGIDTLLAFGTIELENIKNIFIELGGQNSIVVDGESFPLQIEGDRTVEISVDIENIVYNEFLVDFFACTSIIQIGEAYFLDPIIIFKGDRAEHEELIIDLIEDFESCYELVFPISFIDENSNTVTANTRMELVDLLISTEIEDIVLPISVKDQEGNLIAIHTLEEAQIFSDCEPVIVEEEDEDEVNEFADLLEKIDECYDIVFPIALLNDLGESLDANNNQELIEIFENNEIEDAVFPIQLIDTNGAHVDINNAGELFFLDLEC